MIMNDLKKQIRKEFLQKRNLVTNRADMDCEITRKLISECSDYERIFVYISYSSEVSTIDFIEKMLSQGKQIYVPVCDISTCTMSASHISSLNDLRENKYGILEPKRSDEIFADFDVIIFPGVAFDVRGHRIGYGKGYYDKFVSNLKTVPTKIGICYDFQLQNSIPCETHDVKMDMILTEKRRICI